MQLPSMREWHKIKHEFNSVSYVNVLYAPGAGGNFLLTLMRELLKLNRIIDPSDANTNYKETDRNEFLSGEFLPIMSSFHVSQISKDTTFKDFASSRNIYIRPTYDDYMNICARLFVYKRNPEYGDNIEQYQELSDEYIDLEYFMIELKEQYPESVFILDYKNFFIERDQEHINKFYDYILAFNEVKREFVNSQIKRYHEKNVELIQNHLSINPDVVRMFLNNE